MMCQVFQVNIFHELSNMFASSFPSKPGSYSKSPGPMDIDALQGF